MLYNIFNAVAHLCMILLVLYILIFMVVPALLIGGGGLFGLNVLRNRMPDWLKRAGGLPRQGLTLVDKGCNLAAWPVIQGTSLWRGAKTAVAALRRQATYD
jgi:hypothetical protein